MAKEEKITSSETVGNSKDPSVCDPSKCVTDETDDRDLGIIEQVSNHIAQIRNTDVFLYIGGIDVAGANMVLDLVLGRTRKRPNVLLIMSTLGGDAHAAYKIAKCFQCHYKKFSLLIPGYCKSAGTLVAIGANELIFSPYGELGPLDVQVPKKDELGELESGWTMKVALDNVIERAFGAFEDCFLTIIRKSGFQITVRTAGKIATDFATGLFSPICQQINPAQLGSVTMALFVAGWYGEKLDEKSRNLKPDAMGTLISGYPSHILVIDHDEATLLFEKVRTVEKEEAPFGYFMRANEELLWDSRCEPLIGFLSDEQVEEVRGDQDDENEPRTNQKAVEIAENSANDELSNTQEVLQRPGTLR